MLNPTINIKAKVTSLILLVKGRLL